MTTKPKVVYAEDYIAIDQVVQISDGKPVRCILLSDNAKVSSALKAIAPNHHRDFFNRMWDKIRESKDISTWSEPVTVTCPISNLGEQTLTLVFEPVIPENQPSYFN